MSDIQFEEKDNLNAYRGNFQRFRADLPSEKGMVGWLIKKGLVKNEDIATYVLIGVAVFFFAMSALVYFFM